MNSPRTFRLARGIMAVGIIAADALAALRDSPVRAFQLLYCGWIGLITLYYTANHVRFYKWFSTSKLSLASKRGLGAHPCKLYGLFEPPRLSPSQLRLAGLAFSAANFAACLPLAPRVFCFLAYLLYFVYFPQLFAEARLSGHGTILVPSLLVLLACAPSLDHEVQSSSPWPLVLIRFYLASAYFASGMCKLLCGVRFGTFWGRGSTLQMYVFDSMWSRPAVSPLISALQRFVMARPALCTLLATSALIFETGFVVAAFHPGIGFIFGLAGFGFHGGIMAMQGLDFVTYWAPSLLAFVVGVPLEQPWHEILREGWAAETYFFLPAAAYTIVQLVVACTLYDFWLDDIMPFTCAPMFMLPRSIYDKLPKFWTMTDVPHRGSPRLSGSMEPLYWSPASSVFEMSIQEAHLLPYKVVWFGSSTGCPPEVTKFVAPHSRDKEFMLFANFDASDELVRKLRGMMAHVNGGDLSNDAVRIHRLLDMQTECMEAFYADAAAARAREETAKPGGPPRLTVVGATDALAADAKKRA